MKLEFKVDTLADLKEVILINSSRIQGKKFWAILHLGRGTLRLLRPLNLILISEATFPNIASY